MLGAHRVTMLLNLALFLLSGALPSAYRHMRRHIAPHCAQQGDKFLRPCANSNKNRGITYNKQVVLQS